MSTNRNGGMMAKSQKLAALQKPSALDECKQTLESQKKTIAALEKRVNLESADKLLK